MTDTSREKLFGVHRQTVAEHHGAKIEAALLGTCQQASEYDHAFNRIDSPLRDKGIVLGC